MREDLILAVARAIGGSICDENHYVRAKAVLTAIKEYEKNGTMPPIPKSYRPKQLEGQQKRPRYFWNEKP